MIALERVIIRIMLVEDHEVVRAGLRLLLENHPGLQIVGEASNCSSALDIAARTHPDIILLDLDLGTESGLDILPTLVSTLPNTRVVILTGLHDVNDHRRAISLGAVGLVHKEQAPAVLFRAIEKVYAGEVWLERMMLASVLNELVLTKTKPASSDEIRNASLTEREREVVALIGEGLKNKQIGQRMSISETTVRHHLTSIFSKLGVESRLEMVIFAHRYGLTKSPLHR